jgi:uncharacterized protein YidB (DUF937 family)
VTISPIGTTSVTGLSGVQGVGRSGSTARKAAFDAVAQELGMTTTDLRSSLKSGQTIGSLATSKGVSTDAITTAITAALTAADPTMSAGRASTIAQRMLQGPQASQGVGGPGGPGGVSGHHHHGGPGKAMKAAFDAAATTLGVSTSDLRASLESGQTLTSLAAAKGVSTDSLTSAIATALTKADTSLTTDQASSIAQQLVAGPQKSGGAQQTGHVDRDNDGD